MRVVDHERGAAGAADGEQFRHGREGAVHGKQPVGDHDCFSGMLAKQLVDVRGVAVAVHAHRGTLGLGQAAAVDDAGVVALVRQN